MTEVTGRAKVRILVVDDEEGIRAFLDRLLRRLPKPPPVEIETASSAEEALDLLERGEYDLVISDFNMGGQDGITLLATAKARWPNTLRLLMTGYTDDSIKRNAERVAGVAAFVRKPVDHKDLLVLVGGLLARS